MMKIHVDQLEELAERGEHRGADQVLDTARFLVEGGSTVGPGPQRRLTGRPVLAGLAAFVLVLALATVPLTLLNGEARLDPAGTSRDYVGSSGLGVAGDYFVLDHQDWLLEDAWTGDGPSDTFSLYRNGRRTLTVATGSVAAEQLDLLNAGTVWSGAVLRHDFDGGAGFSWATLAEEPVVVVTNGLTSTEALEVAADLVAVDLETWRTARASALGSEGPSTATTTPADG